MNYTLHCGDMALPALVLAGTGGAIHGSSAGCKRATASLTSDIVVEDKRTRTAAVWLVLAHLGSGCWAVPLLRTAFFARQKCPAAMRSIVLFASKHFQIVDTVVQRVAVLVVNHFSAQEGTPQVSFNDDPMLVSALIRPPFFRRQNPVAVRNSRSRFVVAVSLPNCIFLSHNVNYNA